MDKENLPILGTYVHGPKTKHMSTYVKANLVSGRGLRARWVCLLGLVWKGEEGGSGGRGVPHTASCLFFDG